MIDADFERAMNGGRTKETQAMARHYRHLGIGCNGALPYYLRTSGGYSRPGEEQPYSRNTASHLISKNCWGKRYKSKGSTDPIGQGEVW